ncbi:hypothetical protein [Lysobacter gummosus]|uniref:hypothetical protein n=1 Tax=Lysobacter gummosus TaxID=262324 RepID=UPI003635D8E4
MATRAIDARRLRERARAFSPMQSSRVCVRAYIYMCASCVHVHERASAHAPPIRRRQPHL